VGSPLLRLTLVLTSVALSLFAASTAAASTAAAAPAEFFGVVQGAALDGPDIRKMAATGVRTERFVLSWGSVQPSQGSFDWGSTDLVVGGLASHGIRPVPTLWGSAGWAAATPAYPPIDSASAQQAWQDFLEAAVERYGPGGSYWADGYRQQYGTGATPLPIRAWQVWTEPNGKAYFAPQPSAKRYAKLLRISHDAIKSRDPKAQIVLAGLVGLRAWDGRVLKGVPAWKFLSRLYRVHGVRSDFDIAALHPYAPNLDQLRRQMRLTRAAMKKNGDKRKPLWITELGWGSAPRDSDNSVLHLNRGMRGQRRLLTRSFNLILHHRNSWHVRRLFWYDWRDPAKSAGAPCAFCYSAGLLRHNHEPKPAYHAFARFTRAG
jgi:polysaccharide biosynthesis protein PslG